MTRLSAVQNKIAMPHGAGREAAASVDSARRHELHVLVVQVLRAHRCAVLDRHEELTYEELVNGGQMWGGPQRYSRARLLAVHPVALNE